MNANKQGIALIILLLICSGCSQKQSLEWIPFHWEGDTISGKYIEKAYIYVPVKVEDLPHNFTMQLDLGTYKTLFYGNTIQPYLDEYTSFADKYEIPMFKNITLQTGSVLFKDVNIGYYNGFGEEIPKDSIHSKMPKHIGVIASDIFRNKILVIDYPSCRFAVSDSLPFEYKDLPAEKFDMEKGIIKPETLLRKPKYHRMCNELRYKDAELWTLLMIGFTPREIMVVYGIKNINSVYVKFNRLHRRLEKRGV